MIRFRILLIYFIFDVMVVSAQGKRINHKYLMSIFSGYSISSQITNSITSFSSLHDANNIHSYFIGMSSITKINKHLSLEVGLQQIEKGFKFEADNTQMPSRKVSNIVRYSYRLNYLELPISASYQYQSFSVGFGGVISYLYDAGRTYYDITYISGTGSNSVLPSSSNTKINDERFKKWDTGIISYVQYQLNQHIGFRAQVQKHFNAIDNLITDINYSDIKRNHVYLLGIYLNLYSFGKFQ